MTAILCTAKSQRYCLSASLVSERGTRSIWSSTHAAGGVSIDEWVIAARTLRMDVRPYDGNKALYLTSEYHSLYDCLHCWRSLVHIALDNISKFIKEGLMKDRFTSRMKVLNNVKKKSRMNTA